MTITETKPRSTAQRMQSLASLCIDGDPVARSEMLRLLDPELVGIVRGNRSMQGFRTSAQFEDHVRNVVTSIEQKVCAPRKLSTYLAWQQQRSNRTRDFMDWLRIVAKNAIRDYARGQLGPRSMPDAGLSPKALLGVFASATGLSRVGARPEFTRQQLARQLLEYAREKLEPEQLAVLERHLLDAPFDEIDAELGLLRGSAEQRWRAAVEKLRRHFR